MRRTLFIPVLLLFAAAPAAAQPEIQPGQTVTGELTVADPLLNDSSHYDVWRFRTEPEHMYHVVMRSEDFDAFLAVGPSADGECDCETDDDGAGGTNAELRFTPGAAGTYEIRANAFNANDTGRYTLTLEDEGALPPPDTVAAPGTVLLGVPVSGRLERPDEKDRRGSFLDTYTYHGRRGETLVITLRSTDFDAFLRVGQVHPTGCRPVAGNEVDDDGGGGTDSRVRVQLPSDGDFHIHVGSRDGGESGAYTLTVVRG